MRGLAPYPAYRDVGQRWLDRIPETWSTSRMRYLCDIGTGSGDTIDAEPDGEYPFIVRSDTPLRARTYEFDCEAILTAGDGGVGEVFHHIHGKFLAHQRVYVLRNFQGIDTRFFYYYFSSHFRQMAQDGSARTTVDSVRRWMLTDMPFAVPPPDEQRAIADFLDRETGQIDRLIEKQEQLIDTLRERRSAVIDRCFHDARGKRSTTLRRILLRMDRPATDGLGVVTAFRDGTVTLRSNRREEGFTFSATEHGYQEVLPGDLVFHALDGFAGAVGISDSHGIATPVYHVCRVTPDNDPKYIAMLLRYLGTSGFLSTQAPNVRQRSVDFRNWQTFGRVPVLLPARSEQQRVVRDIDEQTAKIDVLMGSAERFIGLARERRAALVSAAVTGRIDVRGAV